MARTKRPDWTADHSKRIKKANAMLGNVGLIERARQMLNARGHVTAGEYANSRRDMKNWKPIAANPTTHGRPEPIWMETEAQVTTCQLEVPMTEPFRRGKANQGRKITVSFCYYAHARTYHGRYISTEAKAQGERFSVFYNALDPKQNTTLVSEPGNGSVLTAIAVAAWILVSVMFVMMTHS